MVHGDVFTSPGPIEVRLWCLHRCSSGRTSPVCLPIATYSSSTSSTARLQTVPDTGVPMIDKSDRFDGGQCALSYTPQTGQTTEHPGSDTDWEHPVSCLFSTETGRLTPSTFHHPHAEGVAKGMAGASNDSVECRSKCKNASSTKWFNSLSSLVLEQCFNSAPSQAQSRDQRYFHQDAFTAKLRPCVFGSPE